MLIASSSIGSEGVCGVAEIETKSVAADQMPVVDRESTQTLFVDGIHGMTILENVVFLNLTRTTPSAPGSNLPPLFVDTVVRLAIPLGAFVRIANYFQQNLEGMSASGLVQVGAPEKDDR